MAIVFLEKEPSALENLWLLPCILSVLQYSNFFSVQALQIGITYEGKCVYHLGNAIGFQSFVIEYIWQGEVLDHIFADIK